MVLSLAVVANAADSEFYFNEFKDSGYDFEQDGRVCEEVAAYELGLEYGRDYEILKGVEYSFGGLTEGELDVVVKQRSNGNVVLVAEVKCWKNPKGALQKVVSQRTRFAHAINNRSKHLIFENVEKTVLSVENFSEAYSHRSISQLGGVEFGFDQELALTFREFIQLRSRLLKCQASGECKTPL